ncbi:MAG: (E)-4-hydroxy-3-methylbut-2-enyl-diphosphate synthase [Paludibacteraceae bacterium]|nr:(E)-4-hydroxy-3-methylbut-2-enyl-diphosphate synthase [Paludibacteraceae bacterium]
MNILVKYNRRKTSTTLVGGLGIGSDYPIRIQTMANTLTDDIDASVAQAQRCAQAGADLFRFTTQGIKQVESLRQIHTKLQSNRGTALQPNQAPCSHRGFTDSRPTVDRQSTDTLQNGQVPLVADIHFRSDVADAAAEVVEKVRINPGNYANDPATIRERFTHLLNICKAHHTALRIGVNHGSLSQRIMNQYGDTPEGMVASCMEFLRIAVEEHFSDIVLSIKASNTRIMVDTVRLLVRTMDAENMAFPLHLGVTEAGEGEDGRIKSAVGIGALLADGIGDTVRVSLSEEPEAELPVARALVDYFVQPDSIRYQSDNIISYDEQKQSIFYYTNQPDWALFQLQAAAETGRLLWQYNCQRLELLNPHFTTEQLQQLQKDILQAAGILRYKVEFVSCPGCGRTMFDLQKTVADIKAAFSSVRYASSTVNLPKIAIMGCIVNGPGEMADADFGYVGAGRDRISLYKGKECVLKNIPQEQAVTRLIELIYKK